MATDETSNAAGWLPAAAVEIGSTVPKTEAKPAFWMKPEQGKAVRQFVENGDRRCSSITSRT